MSSKTAFTRKDVIVLACCAIFLLVTLGSVGTSGRRRAKEAVCLSNLRQWGPVFLAFAADNDGYFMRGWWPGSGTPGPFHTDYWMEALRPYYGDNHNLRCCPEAAIPSSEVKSGIYTGGLGTSVGWGVFPGECGQPSYWWSCVTACDYGSYGMNAWACNPPPDVYTPGHQVTPANWRTANIPGGQDIPLLIGAQWVDAWPDATDMVPEYDGVPWGMYAEYSHMVRVCINRHNGFVNSVFLDGSARKVPLKCLWKLRWHRRYNFDYAPTEAEFNSAGDGWMAEFPPCE